MKVQMLQSSIDENSRASLRQHLVTFIVDDTIAIDAGCLAMSCTEAQREQVRDVILTHTHLDHIAGLPMFIDDLFASLREPITIHATAEMIRILEEHIFNWEIYPRFSKLTNDHGPVVTYREIERGAVFDVKHLTIRSVGVNHPVSAAGYVIADGTGSIAITGDTAETAQFWEICNSKKDLRAVFVECAFPDELVELAAVSEHLTPARMAREIGKLTARDYPVYIINIKPMYREKVIAQISEARLDNVEILELGRVYEF